MPFGRPPTSAPDKSRELCAEARELREAANKIRAQCVSTRIDAEQLHTNNPHDLVPLDLVVAQIWRDIYGGFGDTVPSRKGAHLDGLAYTVAVFCPIYVYEHSTSRRVTPEEISNCLFRDGAKEIRFVDGRPPLKNLAIAAKAAPALIRVLKVVLSRG